MVQSGDGRVDIPLACPSCQGSLEFDKVRLRCLNTLQCPAQQVGTVLNWIRAVEIDDLSEKRLQAMMDRSMVRGPADLYVLTPEQLLQLPQTKDKLALKLYQNIQKTKKLPLQRFLHGLGIEGMGLTTWEKLLESIDTPTLEGVMALGETQIMDIHGFAEKSAHDLVRGLRDRRELISELLQRGVEVIPFHVKPASKSTIAGLSFVITGTLSQPRDEIAKKIKQAGGKVSGSISAATYALVTNDPQSTSSKMKKARELGILIMNEQDLHRLLSREEIS